MHTITFLIILYASSLSCAEDTQHSTPKVNAFTARTSDDDLRDSQLRKNQAAVSSWNEIVDLRISPLQAADMIAAALVWPPAHEARVESPGGLIARRLRLLRQLCARPVPLASPSAEAAWKARQRLTEAALGFVRAMLDAASLDSLREAEAEVKAAVRAIADLPPELRANPELWDRASGMAYDHVKNPTIKKVLLRRERAMAFLEWAKHLHNEAAENKNEVQKLAAKMIGALYSEASFPIETSSPAHNP